MRFSFRCHHDENTARASQSQNMRKMSNENERKAFPMSNLKERRSELANYNKNKATRKSELRQSLWAAVRASVLARKNFSLHAIVAAEVFLFNLSLCRAIKWRRARRARTIFHPRISAIRTKERHSEAMTVMSREFILIHNHASPLEIAFARSCLLLLLGFMSHNGSLLPFQYWRRKREWKIIVIVQN